MFMTLPRADIERSDRPSENSRTADMVRIPGGTFSMGSNDHYPEEAPVHLVTVTPGGVHMANTWQGEFPLQNFNQDGYERTSPVMAFPPNGSGVHDMIGNVWEWTADWYAPKHEADAPKACCVPENLRGGREDGSYDPRQPSIQIPRKVIKGGSHLCAPNYCRRYRPAARHAEAVDTSTSHLGFRCVRRDASSQ
jgi:formylglycine-generating enzyme